MYSFEKLDKLARTAWMQKYAQPKRMKCLDLQWDWRRKSRLRDYEATEVGFFFFFCFTVLLLSTMDVDGTLRECRLGHFLCFT